MIGDSLKSDEELAEEADRLRMAEVYRQELQRKGTAVKSQDQQIDDLTKQYEQAKIQLDIAITLSTCKLRPHAIHHLIKLFSDGAYLGIDGQCYSKEREPLSKSVEEAMDSEEYTMFLQDDY